jgi:hypothetical protein
MISPIRDVKELEVSHASGVQGEPAEISQIYLFSFGYEPIYSPLPPTGPYLAIVFVPKK